jgi:hypothetical protein
MKRLLAVLVVMFAHASGAMWAQSDPFVGTWQLDLEQSRFDPGPGPQNQTRTWAADGKVKVEGIDDAGEPILYEYPVMCDGVDYAITGALPNAADTISSSRIGPNTIDAVFSRQSKPADSTRFSVSDDGQTLTVASKGSSPDGDPMNQLLVYRRQ